MKIRPNEACGCGNSILKYLHRNKTERSCPLQVAVYVFAFSALPPSPISYSRATPNFLWSHHLMEIKMNKWVQWVCDCPSEPILVDTTKAQHKSMMQLRPQDANQTNPPPKAPFLPLFNPANLPFLFLACQRPKTSVILNIYVGTLSRALENSGFNVFTIKLFFFNKKKMFGAFRDNHSMPNHSIKNDPLKKVYHQH